MSFHCRSFGSQIFILDGFPKPAGIVLLSEMVQPGLIVHPVRQLHEDPEVLGTEVQLSGRATEVEAPVLSQLARGVLAHVAAMLRFGRKRTDP